MVFYFLLTLPAHAVTQGPELMEGLSLAAVPVIAVVEEGDEGGPPNGSLYFDFVVTRITSAHSPLARISSGAPPNCKGSSPSGKKERSSHWKKERTLGVSSKRPHRTSMAHRRTEGRENAMLTSI